MSTSAARLVECFRAPLRAAESAAARCGSLWPKGVVAVLLCSCMAPVGPMTAAEPPSRPPVALGEIESIYLERCGGCHGIQGYSAPREVPSLRGRVGYFLCLPQGRAYLVRLPSLASSPLSDDTLARLMNFVVFDLGGRPADPSVHALFTAEEVRELRRQPLNNVSLARYRSALVSELIERCGAPQDLREYAGAQGD
jgi:hypothetical protein